MHLPRYKKLAASLSLALLLVGKLALPALAQSSTSPPSPTEPALPPIQPIEPETIPKPQTPPLDIILPERGTDSAALDCLPLTESGEPSFKAIAIQVVGSTVLQSEIAETVACYEGKEITLSDLFVLRSQITQLYLDNGYITSGAFIPSGQLIDDGQLVVKVIEGSLEEIQTNGLRNLNDSYVENRIRRAARSPLNQQALQRALQLLQLDPNIQRVDAELTAGAQPGQSLLILDLEETNSFSALAEANNYRSPSVGSESLNVSASYRNLIGTGDVLSASYGFTEGLDLYDVSFSMPFNTADGTVSIRYSQSESQIVEDLFEDAGIRSKTESVSVSVRQPIGRSSPSEEFALGLAFDWRQSQSFILDDVPFSFSVGPEDGLSQVSVLRFSQDWTKRDRQRVLAARSQFSIGLDILGATDNNTGTDGQFFAWLGQFQWVEQVSSRSVSVVKVNAQLTPDSLLPLERFSLGGINTVRGYAQNEVVTDNAVNASAEVRIPITRSSDNLQVVPFLEAGYGWNNKTTNPDNSFLLGTGASLRWQATPDLLLRTDYGIPLVADRRGSSLQENGLYFSLIYQVH